MGETKDGGPGRAPVLAWAGLALTAVLAAAALGPAGDGRPGVFRFRAMVVDVERRLITIDAEVAQTQVPLELLLCPKGQKEHESVLAAEVEPAQVHAALLLAGAKPGRPVRYEPYTPPGGQRVKVWVEQTAPDGRVTLTDGRLWVRQGDSPRPLVADFVFTGSQFYRPAGGGRPIYAAENGHLLCVSNFPDAVVDVATRSSDKEGEWAYEAWTERIPPKGTKVRVHLEPLLD